LDLRLFKKTIGTKATTRIEIAIAEGSSGTAGVAVGFGSGCDVVIGDGYPFGKPWRNMPDLPFDLTVKV